MSELGDRLSAKVNEVRTAVEEKLTEDVLPAVNTKIDELQALVDEANAKIDELQGQTEGGAEGGTEGEAAPA